MTRRRTLLSQLSRDSYLLSRAAGDGNALESGGPARLAKRVVRRHARRALYGLGRSLTRGLK